MNEYSTMDKHDDQFKLASFSTQSAIFSRLTEDHPERFTSFTITSSMLIYITLLGFLLIILCIILKFLRDLDRIGVLAPLEQTVVTENSGLLPRKKIAFSYGTCEKNEEVEEDIETGKCNMRPSSDSLNDEKLCILCYDEQRSCFFVPCGHCVACYFCAHRIADGESKTCPICRRSIRRVRMLFTAEQQKIRRSNLLG